MRRDGVRVAPAIDGLRGNDDRLAYSLTGNIPVEFLLAVALSIDWPRPRRSLLARLLAML
jgi:hypothetical protein